MIIPADMLTDMKRLAGLALGFVVLSALTGCTPTLSGEELEECRREVGELYNEVLKAEGEETGDFPDDATYKRELRKLWDEECPS